MLDIILRPLKDIVVDPLILILKNLRVSPNVFTMLSGLCGKSFSNFKLLTGLIGVWYSTKQEQWMSLIFFLLTRLLDGIDGAYARATNQCTEFGGYLDIVVDFTVSARNLTYPIDLWPDPAWGYYGHTKVGGALMDSLCLFGGHFLCECRRSLLPLCPD